MAYLECVGEIINWSSMKELEVFGIEELLKVGGWFNYMEMKDNVYRKEWVEFFENAAEGHQAWTIVNSIKIRLTEELISQCTGCEAVGRKIYDNEEWMKEAGTTWKEVEEFIYAEKESGRQASRLKPQARVLHNLIHNIFIPRIGWRDKVQDYEKAAIWNMMKGEKVNLPDAILRHMQKHMSKISSQKKLVYGVLITKILRNQGVPILSNPWQSIALPTVTMENFTRMRGSVAEKLIDESRSKHRVRLQELINKVEKPVIQEASGKGDESSAPAKGESQIQSSIDETLSQRERRSKKRNDQDTLPLSVLLKKRKEATSTEISEGVSLGRKKARANRSLAQQEENQRLMTSALTITGSVQKERTEKTIIEVEQEDEDMLFKGTVKAPAERFIKIKGMYAPCSLFMQIVLKHVPLQFHTILHEFAEQLLFGKFCIHRIDYVSRINFITKLYGKQNLYNLDSQSTKREIEEACEASRQRLETLKQKISFEEERLSLLTDLLS